VVLNLSIFYHVAKILDEKNLGRNLKPSPSEEKVGGQEAANIP